MRHSKRPRRGRAGGRARGESADALFERALLGDSHSEDRKFDARTDRKTLQLCRQVQRALADELPGDAYVESVEPMGGPGQLLVRVVVPADEAAGAGEVAARLTAQTPRLRAVVAAEISRKRVPMLSFVVVPRNSATPPATSPSPLYSGGRVGVGGSSSTTQGLGGSGGHPQTPPSPALPPGYGGEGVGMRGPDGEEGGGDVH